MIRKLKEEDRKNAMAFLSKEPSINLFIIGDIESFGFDMDFQEIWGQFDKDDDLEGILLRFHESFIPYFIKEDFDTTEFKNIIASHDGEITMSGKDTVINRFDDILETHKRRKTYFCELTDTDNLLSVNYEDIKVAQVDDSERIYNCIGEIKEFNSYLNEVSRIKQKLETNTGRVYYIEDAGKMVSVSQTTAENSMSAMVVGVATLEAYRGQGLMSRCLSKLCLDVLNEGKTLCLFYDNPSAGKVYHKLGFKTIDNWVMVNRM